MCTCVQAVLTKLSKFASLRRSVALTILVNWGNVIDSKWRKTIPFPSIYWINLNVPFGQSIVHPNSNKLLSKCNNGTKSRPAFLRNALKSQPILAICNQRKLKGGQHLVSIIPDNGFASLGMLTWAQLAIMTRCVRAGPEYIWHQLCLPFTLHGFTVAFMEQKVGENKVLTWYFSHCLAMPLIYSPINK